MENKITSNTSFQAKLILNKYMFPMKFSELTGITYDSKKLDYVVKKFEKATTNNKGIVYITHKEIKPGKPLLVQAFYKNREYKDSFTIKDDGTFKSFMNYNIDSYTTNKVLNTLENINNVFIFRYEIEHLKRIQHRIKLMQKDITLCKKEAQTSIKKAKLSLAQITQRPLEIKEQIKDILEKLEKNIQKQKILQIDLSNNRKETKNNKKLAEKKLKQSITNLDISLFNNKRDQEIFSEISINKLEKEQKKAIEGLNNIFYTNTTYVN